jgi:hypothetical protein
VDSGVEFPGIGSRHFHFTLHVTIRNILNFSVLWCPFLENGDHSIPYLVIIVKCEWVNVCKCLECIECPINVLESYCYHCPTPVQQVGLRVDPKFVLILLQASYRRWYWQVQPSTVLMVPLESMARIEKHRVWTMSDVRGSWVRREVPASPSEAHVNSLAGQSLDNGYCILFPFTSVQATGTVWVCSDTSHTPEWSRVDEHTHLSLDPKGDMWEAVHIPLALTFIPHPLTVLSS